MEDLIDRYQLVKQRIATATEQTEALNDVALLAVSKKHGTDKIRKLAAAGQHDFGESYAQEGVKKIKQLSDMSLVWHFIGPIQSNKAKLIANNFNWVHSVDRLKVLQLLNQNRAAIGTPINVLLQIKVGGEESKSGATREAVLQLAETAQELPFIELRGLMCIPPPSHDFAEQCRHFQPAKSVFDELVELYDAVDTLSIGMSQDLEAAIHSGSTMVRVGTDIFGQRVN